VFYWLKEELEKLEYKVIMPNLPTQEHLRYAIWKERFEGIKKDLDGELIAIIHSGGNPFMIKYLRESNLSIKLYIGLAGWSDRHRVEGREDLNACIEDLAPSEKDFEHFKNNVEIRYGIYSDNDHVVPFEILRKHVDNIGGKHCMIPNIGHMGKKSNLQELPQVIKILQEHA